MEETTRIRNPDHVMLGLGTVTVIVRWGRAFPLGKFYQRFVWGYCTVGYGWRFGVAVTRWSRSTQLLYIEPG